MQRSNHASFAIALVLTTAIATVAACGDADPADPPASDAGPDAASSSSSSSASSSGSSGASSSSSSSSGSASSSSSSSGSSSGTDASTDAPTDGPRDAGRDGDADADATTEPGFCEPSPVPDFTFNPPPRYPGFCSDASINSFLINCVFDQGTQQSCTAAVDALSAACSDCIYGGFDSSPATPLVQYTIDNPIYASTGTCMANFVNSTDDECANAFGQIETCAYASCLPSCVGATDEEKSVCYDKAIGTICTKGLATFDTLKCRNAYAGKTYGFCLTGDNPDAGGKKLNNLEYYTLVTKLACGFDPDSDADAGP